MALPCTTGSDLATHHTHDVPRSVLVTDRRISRRRIPSGRTPDGHGPGSRPSSLEAEDDRVWALQEGAVVYVCGNASTMAPGVRAALVAVFRARTGAGDADGEAWLSGLRASGR